MKPLFLFATLLAASSLAGAQQPSRWGLGVGAAVSDSVYAGEGTRVTPFPLVSYQGERFYWRGVKGGAHLVKRGGFALDATLSARFDGIDQDDFGVAELAERGIDRKLLEDRDDAVDLGLAASWRGAMGQLDLGVEGDVTSTSKGHEASLTYGYPVQWGAMRITPNVGVSHLSKKLANYYYGTLPEEVGRGVARYQPGSVAVARIGVDVVRPFAGNWVFIGNVDYRKLPTKLSDSPLVEKDKNGAVSAFIGFSRGF
jgi:outer membrane protein